MKLIRSWGHAKENAFLHKENKKNIIIRNKTEKSYKLLWYITTQETEAGES